MMDYGGQGLGNYHLVSLLGRGAFADVYLGEHIYLNSQAAVKVLNAQLTPEVVDQFRNNEILLADFGIATVAHSTRSFSMQNEAGTAAYMAPEQIRGQACIASDQYALGVAVYEWLCGDRPFNGLHWEVFNQHLSTPPPSLRGKLSSISPAVEQVVMQALSKKTAYKLLTSYENPVILSDRQHKSLMKGGCLMQVPTPIVCCAANCR